MKTLKEKNVSFAYPTSDVAEAFGKYQEGTWYVEWVDNKANIEMFVTRSEALAFAETLPLPYGRQSFTPEMACRRYRP